MAETDGFGSTRLARYSARGEPDAGFDAGGTLDLDFGELHFGRSDAAEVPLRLLLSPDARTLLLRVNLETRDTPAPFCAGIARLSLDGTRDATFGSGGLSCLTGTWNLDLAVQGTGAPLLSVLSDFGGTMIRLLLDDHPSPGLIGVTHELSFAAESAGTTEITVARSGGKDGAVGIDYSTVAGTATSGSDDAESEGTSLVNTAEEEFGLELSLAGGEPLTLTTSPARVLIQDNDPRPTTAPQASSSGDGGSTSVLALLALAAIVAARRRPRADPRVQSISR